MKKSMAITALLTGCMVCSALAEESSMTTGAMQDHMTMGDHHRMEEGVIGGASGQGVINVVNAEKSVINITHGPIPALSWPEMTMDIPVTEQVDLDLAKPGETVDFKIMLGSDNVYRITEMTPAH